MLLVMELELKRLLVSIHEVGKNPSPGGPHRGGDGDGDFHR